jgi:hypothetical protein
LHLFLSGGTVTQPGLGGRRGALVVTISPRIHAMSRESLSARGLSPAAATTPDRKGAPRPRPARRARRGTLSSMATGTAPPPACAGNPRTKQTRESAAIQGPGFCDSGSRCRRRAGPPPRFPTHRADASLSPMPISPQEPPLYRQVTDRVTRHAGYPRQAPRRRRTQLVGPDLSPDRRPSRSRLSPVETSSTGASDRNSACCPNFRCGSTLQASKLHRQDTGCR